MLSAALAAALPAAWSLFIQPAAVTEYRGTGPPGVSLPREKAFTRGMGVFPAQTTSGGQGLLLWVRSPRGLLTGVTPQTYLGL